MITLIVISSIVLYVMVGAASGAYIAAQNDKGARPPTDDDRLFTYIYVGFTWPIVMFGYGFWRLCESLRLWFGRRPKAKVPTAKVVKG